MNMCDVIHREADDYFLKRGQHRLTPKPNRQWCINRLYKNVEMRLQIYANIPKLGCFANNV